MYQPAVKKRSNFIDNRLAFLAVILLAFAILLIGKLAYMQLWRHNYYNDLADRQYQADTEIQPDRGEIFLQDLKEADKYFPLATNREFYLVYVNPTEVKYPQDTLDKLVQVLGIEAEEQKTTILNRLIKDNDVYEPIEHKITAEQKAQLEDYNIAGLYFSDEIWRYYPEGSAGSHLVGFVSSPDNGYEGQYGLEGYFNEELAGVTGEITYSRDALGSIIPTAERVYEKAEDGFDLVLTIDRSLEFRTCDLLAKHAVKYGAANGTVIIMNPSTGAIMAMCSYPDFDPNEYNQVESMDVYNNPAIFTAYEPGSVFKAITMALAIDQNKITPETTYEDTGTVEIGEYTIHNALGKIYGVQNMTQVLENSINTGAIWAAQQVGLDKFREYVQNFGFGQLTGITLDREVTGNVSSLDKKGDIYLATASYGQGVTATPIQLITAFSAIANGGKLMKPYLVDKVVFPSGLSEQNKPVTVRQVISAKTSLTVSAMLASVVESGHGKNAAVAGYYVAGKTGTAQVATASGQYDPNKTIHTFIGFAPVNNPAFVMLVKFDYPTNVEFAESSAVPLFAELAQFLLQYLQVPTEK